MIRFLPEALILMIHEDQVRLYGGSHGIRDTTAFDAAINMPKAQFAGQFLHTTIFQMAAACSFHLCQNHPFIDGNKRTAGMVMLTFLKLNGLEPIATESDYYTIMIGVASGQVSKEALAEWLSTAVSGAPPDGS